MHGLLHYILPCLQIAKWKVKQGQLRVTLLDSLAKKIGVSSSQFCHCVTARSCYPVFLAPTLLLPLQAFEEDEAAMFQVYRDGILLQNSHNLLCLMEQYQNRSSIADEMGVLLQCHCLFISARGSRQAKEVVSASVVCTPQTLRCGEHSQSS